MSKRIKQLTLFTWLFLAGCTPGEEYIDLTVRYIGQPQDPGINVSVYAGKDRVRLRTLQAGKQRNVRLVPGRSVTLVEGRRVFLRYYPKGMLGKVEPVDWYGPDVAQDVNLRLEVTISGDGQIESRYCIKPCKL